MSITKKIFVGVSAIALALAFASKSEAAYVHTVTLKMGVHSSQVMSLQQTLNMTSCKVSTVGAGSPGMETSTFAAKTKAAVMCFQAAHGLTADGIVGPATGAALAAVTGTSTGGTTTPGTCPAGYVCTPNGSNNNGALQGDAGDIIVTQTSSDVEDTVKEGDSNTKTLGFKVEASGSDVAIKSLKVTLQNTHSGTDSTRLERYFNTVSVWEGNTKVGSADVADFTKSGTTYTKSITLNDNAIIREGASNKQTFYVALSTVSNIDSADLTATWNVKADNIRFTDAQGAILTDSSSVNHTVNVDTLASSGDVKVSITRGSNNPEAGNIMVSDTGSTSNVKLLEFKVKTTGSSMTLSNVKVALTGTGATPAEILSDLSLKADSQQISNTLTTTLASNGNYTFDLDDDYTIPADSTVTFSVYGKINKIAVGNFGQGDSLQVDFVSFNSTLEDKNGDTFADSSVTGTALGNAQAFFSEGLNVSNFKSSVVTGSTSTVTNAKETYTVSFDVTAFGQTYYIPKVLSRDSATGYSSTATGLVFAVLKSDGTTASTSDVTAAAGSLSSSASTVGGDFMVADGTPEHFTATIEITKNSTAGFYRIQLSQVGYDTDQTGTPTYYTLAPAQDFQTVDSKVD